MATLGVIGGMGAKATAAFYTTLVEMQGNRTEQDYMDVIIYSKTSIPDRTAYILDNSKPNPAPALIEAAKALEKAGADFIAVACVTAHYFYEEIRTAVSIPVINVLTELADFLVQKGIKTIGLLATTGTIQSRLFHNVLEPLGIEIRTLPTEGQTKLMEIIYDVKKGKPLETFEFDSLASLLKTDAIVLGCTELSLLKQAHDIDVLDVLAMASLKLGEAL